MANIRRIVIGDRIEWAGRIVQVVDIQPTHHDRRVRYKRPDRYLVCEVEPGKVFRLHYYDDENVVRHGHNYRPPEVAPSSGE